MRRLLIMMAGLCAAAVIGAMTVLAQGPAPHGASLTLGSGFTYQGQLKRGGGLVTSACVLSFKLYADSNGTILVAGPVSGSPSPVSVVNGLYTVAIDFGASVLNGDARWLQTTVQCTGDSAATTLSPLQPLTAAPYALFAAAPWVRSGSALTYNAGNVGIGAALPAARLDVESAGGNTAIVGDSALGYGVKGIGGNIGVYAQGPNGNVAYLGAPCCAGDFYGQVSVHGAGAGSTALQVVGGALQVSGPVFAHTAHSGAGGNICAGNSATYLDNAYTNDNPNAILIVTPSSTTGVTFAYTPIYAVWSAGGYGSPACPANRWTLHTMNLNDTIADGLQYNVLVFKP